MQFDTGHTIEFRASPIRLCLLAAAVSAFMVGSIAVGWPLMEGVEPGSLIQVCGWVGALGSAFIFLIVGWRIVTIDRPIVTLSPSGILDTRISHDFIPWTDIEKLQIRDIGASGTYAKHRIVSVVFSQEILHNRSFTLSARLMNSINNLLGRGGLAIPSIEFDVTVDEFFALLTAYARTYGGKVD